MVRHTVHPKHTFSETSHPALLLQPLLVKKVNFSPIPLPTPGNANLSNTMPAHPPSSYLGKSHLRATAEPLQL